VTSRGRSNQVWWLPSQINLLRTRWACVIDDLSVETRQLSEHMFGGFDFTVIIFCADDCTFSDSSAWQLVEGYVSDGDL